MYSLKKRKITNIRKINTLISLSNDNATALYIKMFFWSFHHTTLNPPATPAAATHPHTNALQQHTPDSNNCSANR